MRKRMVLIRRDLVDPNQLIAGRTIQDTMRNVAAAVDGPEGALFRYCAGLIIDIRGSATAKGEAPKDPKPYDLLNTCIDSITWSRYGGQFCENLSGVEVLALNAAEGLIDVTKQNLVLNGLDATIQGSQPFRASLVLPYSPSFFTSGSTNQVHQVDAPFPCTLLGASSEIRHQLRNHLDPNDWEIDDPGLIVSWYAWLLETPDFIEARPTSYLRYMSSEDPAIVPAEFCKMPTLLAIPGVDGDPLVFYDSETVNPIVSVDGSNLLDDLNCHEVMYGRGWIRNDFMHVGPQAQPGSPIGNVLILLDMFETDRWIEMAAGSQWKVSQLGKAQHGQLRYLYRVIEEPTSDLLVKQLVNSGKKPSAVNDGNRTINSNPLSEMKLTERDRVGVPVRVSSTRFR